MTSEPMADCIGDFVGASPDKMRMIIAMIPALLVAISSAAAQNWPTRPVALVVPFAAGGSSDAIGRIMADGLSAELGQSVVVENVTGAGGMVGGKPRGEGRAGRLSIRDRKRRSFAQSQWIYKIPPYDVLKDFAPVALITDESLVARHAQGLSSRQSAGIHDLREGEPVEAAVRFKRRRRLQPSGLPAAQFGDRHQVTHIPYRSVVQAMQDVIAGRIDYECLSLPLALPQIIAKTLKAIAILSKSRSASSAGSAVRGRTGADRTLTRRAGTRSSFTAGTPSRSSRSSIARSRRRWTCPSSSSG